MRPCALRETRTEVRGAFPLPGGALLAALLSLSLVAGCSSPPPPPGPGPRGIDLRHARVLESPELRLYVGTGCLDARSAQRLLAEGRESVAFISSFLGDEARPGAFPRPAVSARAYGPGERIEVVVAGKGGRSFADAEGIYLPRDRVPAGDLTHELVHYLAGASWHPIDEGLAVYLTWLRGADEPAFPLDVRARAYFDLHMDQPLRRVRLRRALTRADYNCAGSFVEFLIEEYGRRRFFELYHGPPGCYHAVYGEPEDALLARWETRVRGLDVRNSSPYYRYLDRLESR